MLLFLEDEENRLNLVSCAARPKKPTHAKTKGS